MEVLVISMANRFQIVALWVIVASSPLVGLLLRHEALRSPPSPQEPSFSIELVGWLFLTGWGLGLTLHGLATYANLSQRTLQLLSRGLVALMLIYVGVWGFYEITGQGLHGELLLAGLTFAYSGIETLFLAHLTKDPLLYRLYRRLMTYVIIHFWPLG
jgi:hypothetical protein